jgi:hypothetical protein
MRVALAVLVEVAGSVETSVVMGVLGLVEDVAIVVGV